MGVNSIEESFCEVVASSFEQRGGLAQMGKALGRGMVLAMSIWNDPGQFMNWLDSGNAGPCNATEGNPALYDFLITLISSIG
jgi:cellulase